MCVQFGTQSIHDSTVPAHFIPCIQHATTWLHDGGVFCRQEPAFSASQSSETELSNTEIVVAAHRDLLPNGSVKHDTMSKSLLKEGMLAYHITAAITACTIMAIPLTRANRLAAMRESDERITSIFTPFLQGPLHFNCFAPHGTHFTMAHSSPFHVIQFTTSLHSIVYRNLGNFRS